MAPSPRSIARALAAEREHPTSEAARAIASRGPGAALPGHVAAHLGAAYGADLGGVRIHTDAAANRAAAAAGAEAFTYGPDIFFGAGKFQPSTAEGAFVLAHEVAHAVQDTGAVQALRTDPDAQHEVEEGADSDPAEADASAAATAALSGIPYTPRRGAARVRYFKQGNGTAADGGHAFLTEQALRTMGVGGHGDASAARGARMGNWERDLSQVNIPIVQRLHLLDPIMHILDVLAIKDFGRACNLQEFGGYDPIEHIDNPTDLRADGAFAQGPMQTVGDLHADQRQTEADPAVRARGGAMPGVDAAHQGDHAYADADERYAATAARLAREGHHFRPGETTAAFQVDETGIPVYVNTSKDLLKVQLKNAMRLGRVGNDGRGPRLFASAVHILQDFYAHSNFSQIAINMLIREGNLEVATGERDATGAAQLRRIGLAETHDRVLNSGAHALGADGATAVAANLETNGREVLTTGSFNLTDTVASVLEEVSDRWKQFNPFQRNSREPSQVISAVLDYIELRDGSATEFNGVGNRLAGMVEAIVPTIETVAPTAARAVEGAGSVVASVPRAGGRIASGGLSALNHINAFFGGDADYFAPEQRAVTQATGGAADAIEGAAGAAAQGIRNITTGLHELATSLRGQQHLLRTAYQWVYNNVNPFQWLVDASRHIPVVGERIATMLLGLKDSFLRTLEDIFGRMWNAVIDRGVARINSTLSSIRAATNVENQRRAGAGSGLRAGVQRAFGGVGDMYHDEHGRLVPNNGIAPRTWQPPSHTEIANDHDDLSEGARDGATDGARDPESHQQHADAEHGHPSTGGDEHGHVHLGGWLAPIAEGMAQAATYAVGEVVNRGWDQVFRAATAAGVPDGVNAEPPATYANAAAPLDGQIDSTVDHWFAHPADTRPRWEQFIRAQLRTARMGPELLERLGTELAGHHPGSPVATAAQGTAIIQPSAPAGHGRRTDVRAPGVDPDAGDSYAADPTMYGEDARSPGHEDDHLRRVTGG